MYENRRHFRLREFLDVTWRVADQDASGEGTVVNVSLSGLLLNTDRPFRPTENCILHIESGQQELPFSPKKGRIVWFRHIQTPQDRIQCGIQFVADKPDVRLQQWLEGKAGNISEANNANILGNMAL